MNHNRRSIRLQRNDYSRAGAYAVTGQNDTGGEP
jgi:hypothetical protein